MLEKKEDDKKYMELVEYFLEISNDIYDIINEIYKGESLEIIRKRRFLFIEMINEHSQKIRKEFKDDKNLEIILTRIDRHKLRLDEILKSVYGDEKFGNVF
jgi:hypothetical protein